MEEKDDEGITQENLDAAMKLLLALSAPKERKRTTPSKEDLKRKFRLTMDDGLEIQEVEDE